MPGKIESLIKKLTGNDPCDMEPKPTGSHLQHMLKYARSGAVSRGLKTLEEHRLQERVDYYDIVESGFCGEERYTLIKRRLANGVEEYALWYGEQLNRDELSGICTTAIGSDDWFIDAVDGYYQL